VRGLRGGSSVKFLKVLTFEGFFELTVIGRKNQQLSPIQRWTFYLSIKGHNDQLGNHRGGLAMEPREENFSRRGPPDGTQGCPSLAGGCCESGKGNPSAFEGRPLVLE
jgi:hypothetical protein